MANNTLDTYAKCLDAFKRDVTNVISNLNIAKYEEALENMRKALESMVKAIIHYKNLDIVAKTARKRIGDLIASEKKTAEDAANLNIGTKLLQELINLIANNSWFDANPNKNTEKKDIFIELKNQSNPTHHSQAVEKTFASACLIYFSDFYKQVSWFCKSLIQDANLFKLIEAQLTPSSSPYLIEYYRTLHALYTSPIPIDKNYKLSDLYIVPTETENAVKDWLNQSEQRLFLLLGDAGQGKSSFCKYFLHQQLADENNPNDLKTSITNDPTSRPICFFRLRDITDVKALIKKPIDFLYKQVCNNIDVDTKYLQKSEFHKSILILDGLDELHLLNEKSFAADFIDNLLTHLNKLSKLRVLITSRKGVLDENFEHKLLATNTLAKINLQQQKKWLGDYKVLNTNCALTVEQLDFFNTDYKFKHIKELLELPILLHLIALANIKVDASSNRSSIYKNLFNELQKRAWEDEKLKPFAKLNIDLQTVIREVAFKMHCKGTEFISKLELISLQQENEQLKELTNVDIFQYIMLAFYTNANNQALEFLHKSLKEYLIAEKIWLDVKKITTCATAEEALKLVWGLFSPALLSNEIQNYLTECIQTDTDQVLKSTIFEHLMQFAPSLLEKHFLLPNFETTKPIDHALYAFRGYWVMLAALSNGEKNIVPNDKKDLFAKLLNIQQLLFAQVWDLREVNLVGVDLRGANLRYAYLSGANLMNANLIDVYFIEAHLINANLSGAHLGGADLMRADLRNADIRKAFLGGADFQQAFLTGTHFDIKQLYNAKTVYLSRGLSAEQIAHLKENGYGHLFEKPKD